MLTKSVDIPDVDVDPDIASPSKIISIVKAVLFDLLLHYTPDLSILCLRYTVSIWPVPISVFVFLFLSGPLVDGAIAMH